MKKWFKKEHKRELCTPRAKEINATAKQSAECFRNTENAAIRCELGLPIVVCIL